MMDNNYIYKVIISTIGGLKSDKALIIIIGMIIGIISG